MNSTKYMQNVFMEGNFFAGHLKFGMINHNPLDVSEELI